MLNLQYTGEKELYQVDFKYINSNIIEIIGDFPIKTKGFTLTRIDNPNAFTGDYSTFVTVYKNIDNGVQFSNNGLVYVKPIPKVFFHTSNGGVLEGKTTQEVTDYSELVIPTPKADKDYEFTQWSPEIPSSGEIFDDESFTAIFMSTAPVPEEPNLYERVVSLEEQSIVLTSCVLEMSEVIYA